SGCQLKYVFAIIECVPRERKPCPVSHLNQSFPPFLRQDKPVGSVPPTSKVMLPLGSLLLGIIY
ncbi:MAG: hypothetical protein QME51_04930, partial [Planctomycetota bacterium]|nr:hypothetical protein [Planctomycetota bacterium]